MGIHTFKIGSFRDTPLQPNVPPTNHHILYVNTRQTGLKLVYLLVVMYQVSSVSGQVLLLLVLDDLSCCLVSWTLPPPVTVRTAISENSESRFA